MLTEPSPELRLFLRRLPHVRRALLQVLTPDSCIETSRIVHLLLKDLGLASQVVPVEARIANEAAARFIVEGDIQAIRERRNGSYIVIVGAPGPAAPGRWAGHLAVHCEGVLIDASLDQASRPQHGIHIPEPWVVRVPRDFLRDGGRSITRIPGLLVEHVCRPDNTSYLCKPGWHQALLLMPLAQQALLRASSSDRDDSGWRAAA